MPRKRVVSVVEFFLALFLGCLCTKVAITFVVFSDPLGDMQTLGNIFRIPFKLEGIRSLVTVFHLFMNQTEVRLVPMMPGKPWLHGKPLEYHSTMIPSSFQFGPQ